MLVGLGFRESPSTARSMDIIVETDLDTVCAASGLRTDELATDDSFSQNIYVKLDLKYEDLKLFPVS